MKKRLLSVILVFSTEMILIFCRKQRILSVVFPDTMNLQAVKSLYPFLTNI